MKGSLRRLWVFLVLCIAVLSLSHPVFALSRAQEYLLEGSYAVEQDGWTLVHLEGVPYRIGFQRGYLTAESASYLIISYLGPADDEYHRMSREIAEKYLWDRIPKEYQDELRGIAAGLRVKGYDWDVWDVLAANAWADQGLYEEAWEEDAESRCSAFIATGDATVDGQIVMGHNTRCPYNERTSCTPSSTTSNPARVSLPLPGSWWDDMERAGLVRQRDRPHGDRDVP